MSVLIRVHWQMVDFVSWNHSNVKLVELVKRGNRAEIVRCNQDVKFVKRGNRAELVRWNQDVKFVKRGDDSEG